MLTLKEVHKAINDKVKEAGKPNRIPLVAEDITEPIQRPSLKVTLEDSTSGKFNASCREKRITVRIYYFAKDKSKYKLDNLAMQEALEGAFLDGLTIGEVFYIPITEVISTVTDTVLVCSFDLNMVEQFETDTGEPMEELIWR